ncbi:hypothetical protein M271_43985 [Streptomyces rapamycinicus NRRL 5491]|uniref:Uncharacterized protein n=1 Tax=Streptomyces rapamycinicus TaxID=1226757 RepID=A0ABR6M237_9ACTN|nr:hypothetical protein [Streptomyces rapamycinicus]AGP60165.1 hypothetical protein M271_43985 [Streptomyces rapamycinicus NRRL 5491]MBB4788675.1 hypothetical protein [Streptomyces rapamycinicus]UTP35753.1 hypothetical protein LIV37_44730 [Streptomyces rapamycinicus NRRL 5491]
MSGRAQRPYALGDIRVDGQLRQAGEHVVHGHRRVRSSGPVPGQKCAQDVPGDLGERRPATREGQRDAVAQDTGEPHRQQLAGQTDVRQARGERGHVGECLVDVEDEDARTAVSGHGDHRSRWPFDHSRRTVQTETKWTLRAGRTVHERTHRR